MNRAYSLKRDEIARVIKSGRPLHSPLFGAKVLLVENIKNVKTAFIAAKKIFPMAVMRNIAKRRARAAFTKNLNTLKIGSYIFFLKKDVITADFKILTNEFLKVCGRQKTD